MQILSTAAERAVSWFAGRGAFCHITGYCASAAESLLPEELPLTKNLCPKRMREFSMGRMLARRCFTDAGLPGEAVLMGPCREPLWPEAVCGSISHNRDYYAAVAADRSLCRSVGIDLESAKRRISDGAFRLVCTEEEQAALYGCDEGASVARIALFSAKEAFYKLLYPLVQKRFSFDGARLTAVQPDRFELELTMDLPGGFETGWRTDVAVFIDRDLVVTCAAL